MTDDTDTREDESATSPADAASDADAAPQEFPADSNGDIRIAPQPPKPDEAAKMRKLFAEAQERYAAMDFAAAEKRLRMIPPKSRTSDVDRLNNIVRTRLEEISSLRWAIGREVDRQKWERVQPKLQRLLELQPGDDWANNLRHTLEDREWEAAHPAPAPPKPQPEPEPETVAEPTAEEPTVLEPIFDEFEDPPPVESKPSQPGPLDSPVAPVFIAEEDEPEAVTRPKDEADEQLEEIWEFGERLERAPPPIPGRRRRPVAVEADEIDLVGSPPPSAGVWIAVMVSSLVVLVAVVTTIVVLVNYTK